MKLFFSYFIFCLFSLLLCGCKENSTSLPGYIEGEYTYIASGVSGTLFDLYVVRGQTVKAGDLLYQLDPQPETAVDEQRRADIANLEAQLNFAKLQLTRQEDLAKKNAASQSELDRARTDFISKSQQLIANRAALIQSDWALQQKKISAPVNGEVFDTFYRVGEKVAIDRPVLAILNPKNIKVLFYLPEKKLSQIKIGQTIEFSCDNCKGKTKANIIYISPEAEYTPPVIYSKDTRDKLVYLVRAAISENIANQFHPGQPIDVFLYE